MTDDEIVQGCSRNDPATQKFLYQKFCGQMMGVCMRYANDRDQAQDIMQDGFVKVFQKIESFRGDGPLGGWVSRTMVNTALDHLRRNKHHEHNVNIDDAQHLATADAEALSNMATNELLALIQALPPGYRAVFNMFAIEGYSHKDIAEQLGVSENTSKSQFMKAKAYLRKMMPEEISTDGRD